MLGLIGYLALQRGLPASCSCIEVIALVVLPSHRRTSPELRQRRRRRGHPAARPRDIGLFRPLNARRRRRLPARRALLRHRPVPRRHPRPLGCRPARRRRRRDHGHPPAAAGQPAPVRRAQRHRHDRPRLVAVARAALRRPPSPLPAPPTRGSTRPAPDDRLPTAPPTRSARPTGWVPVALVALVVIPAVAGSLRLVELAGGPLLMPANPRITASPAAGGRAHRSAPCRMPCSAPSSSPRGCAAATRAGTGRAGRVVVAARPGRGALRPVDDAVLRPPAGHRRAGLPVPARLRRRPWPPASCSASRRSAAATCATHRAWMTRAYAIALAAGTQIVHPRRRDGGLRPRRTHHGPEPGRRLGHQPRGRRGRHPPSHGRGAAGRAASPVGAP